MNRFAQILMTLVLAVGATVPASVTAQEVAPDIDALYEKYFDFPKYVDGGMVVPHWLPDGSRFWYAEEAPADTAVWLVDPAASGKTPFFDVARLRTALAKELGHEPPYSGVPFATFDVIDGGDGVRFELEGAKFRLNLSSYSLEREPALSPREQERQQPRVTRSYYPITAPDLMEVPSPDGRWLAGECGQNLCLRSTFDGRTQPLTRSGEALREWSVAGASWSPDGLRIAAMQSDANGIDRVPTLHWLNAVEEIDWVTLPRVGAAIPLPGLRVIDVRSGTETAIDTGGEGDHLVRPIGWTKGGEELLFYRMNRDFKTLQVRAANPETGKSRVLAEERQPTFIKGITSNPGWGDLFTLLPDSRRFIMLSERDGWDHLYLYDFDGKLIRRLTDGEWPVLGITAVDEKNGWVYFTANPDKDRPYDTHLLRVGLDGKNLAQLTEGEGEHMALLSPSRDYFVDIFSSPTKPPVSELRKSDGTRVQVLGTADMSRARTELGWSPPEEFVVTAADGKTKLYGTLFKPSNFDPARKYPVLDHIYNGPQSVWAPKTFTDGRGVWMQALAQLGFVVFAVDGRGTVERGKAFQDVAYGDFGGHEIDDHAAALQELAAARPYMDTNRVGMFGGSWGGYMTARALLTRPDVYHVGIATNGVYDLYDHAAGALEPYMGRPIDRPEAFEAGSSLKLAGNLEGKLLIIGSTHDVNATFSATMKLTEALIRADKPFDLLVLPDQNHHPSGQSGRYYRDTHKRYFVEHLKP